MNSVSGPVLDHLRTLAARPAVPGRYILHEMIGAGGMGSVWRARDRILGRDVALKVLAPHLEAEEFEEHLLREASVLARLEHPGIVPIHDAGRLADGRGYYTMKLIRGRRLDEHAVHLASEGELLRLFMRACDAVAFANDAGVIHRDLKPANVMVGKFGEALVLDWGVAQVVAGREPGRGPAGAGGDPTAPGAVVGTPGFMAPEQAAGLPELDARTDVYGLGAMLESLLRGRPVAAPLRSIIRRAMASGPEARYPTASALAADIARHLDGEPVEAHAESWPERAGRFGRRHRVAILLVGGYIIMRVAILLWRGI